MAEATYITGPWRGIEQRETYQTPQHDEFALNVDYSSGYKRARPGMASPRGDGLTRTYVRVLDPMVGTGLNLGGPAEPRMKEVTLFDGSKGILCVGSMGPWAATITVHGAPVAVDRPAGDIGFVVFNLDLHPVATGNLTFPWDALAGTIPLADSRQDFRCSFVDMYAPTGQKMVAVVSNAGTWVWDPNAVPPFPLGTPAPPWPYWNRGDMRALRMSGAADADFAFLYPASRNYFALPPRCTIATFHNDLGYFAGFAPRDGLPVQAEIEADQDGVAEVKITNDRLGIRFGPEDFIVSDPAVPFSIHTAATFNLDLAEHVTGMQPVGDALVVFADRAIYTIAGDPVLQEVPISKLADGVGCVAPHAIVAASGVVYFMAHNGIHRIAEGQVQNISDGISGLWTGEWNKTRVNDTLLPLFSALKWPWKIDHKRFNEVTAVHLRDRKQIWWSLPIAGRTPGSRPIGLVFDYANEAFSFYTFRDAFPTGVRSGAGTFFSDGLQIETGGKLRTFFCQRSETDAYANIVELGARPFDATGNDIPFAWQTGRVGAGNDKKLSFRRVRFELLATRKSRATTRAFLDGDEAAFDVELEGSAVTAAERQSDSLTLATHPRETNTYFFSVGFFGATKFSSKAFFESRCDPKAIASKHLYLGVADESAALSGADASPSTVTRGIFVDVGIEGRSRR